MYIRTAQVFDIPAIQRLYRQLFALTAQWQPNYYRTAVQDEAFLLNTIQEPDTDILLVEDNTEVVGFLLIQAQSTPLYTCVKPRSFAYITDLAVDERVRRQGIGTMLLHAAGEWAGERGLEYLELSVLHENENARIFYAKLGMTEAIHTLRKEL